jgi:hypothetical protein
MSLHDEIAKVAHELYEKSGRIHGRDLDNWINAERIVMERHAKVSPEEAEKEAPKKKAVAKKTTKKAEAKKEETKKVTRTKKTK